MSHKYLFHGRPIIESIMERMASMSTLANSLQQNLAADNDAQAEETMHMLIHDCVTSANHGEMLLEQLQARPGRLPGNPRVINKRPPNYEPAPPPALPAVSNLPSYLPSVEALRQARREPPASASTLLGRYRSPMVRLLSNASPAYQGDASLRQFCEQVLDHLDQLNPDDTPAKREYLPGEAVLLWSHNELMELADVEKPMPDDDPYLRDMLARLRDFGGRLARNEELPDGFAIHWLQDDLDNDEHETTAA